MWTYTALLVVALAAGYWIASRDPIRHWPIVFVGLVGKLLGPLAFFSAVRHNAVPISSLWTIGVADIAWWLPFGYILASAYNANREQPRRVSENVLQMAMRARTNKGVTLAELSTENPVLLVFLRHSGCPFCRETLNDIARQRVALEATGTTIAFVYMGDEHRTRRVLLKHRLDDVPRIADPSLSLYRAFGLQRGSPFMLLSPGTWIHVFQSAILRGNGFGIVDGDPRQMPGVFVVFHEQVLRSYRHQNLANRPDYVGFVSEDSAPQVLW